MKTLVKNDLSRYSYIENSNPRFKYIKGYLTSNLLDKTWEIRHNLEINTYKNLKFRDSELFDRPIRDYYIQPMQ
jgi:hypothetical protein